MKIIHITFLSAALVCISPSAFADTPGPTVTLLEEIETTLTQIGTELNAIALSLFAAPTDLGNYLAKIQAMNVISQKSASDTQKSTDQLSGLFLTKDSVDATVSHAYNLSTDGAGDYKGLSAYSLLGLDEDNNTISATYSADQVTAANVYKTFLAGGALAMPVPANAKTMDDKQQANLIRTMAAIQSLDAYNVSRVYAAHYPHDAKKLKLDWPTPTISEQELIRYQMQANVSNPEWYTQMASASSTEVSRQILFVLAAGVSELYRIEQNQEQMLLTQTAGNTIAIATAQTMMQMMNQAKVAAAAAPT